MGRRYPLATYKIDGKTVPIAKAVELVDAKYGKGALAFRALQGIRRSSRDRDFTADKIEVDGHIIEIIFR